MKFIIDMLKDKTAWKKTFTDPGVLGVLLVAVVILLTEFMK